MAKTKDSNAPKPAPAPTSENFKIPPANFLSKLTERINAGAKQKIPKSQQVKKRQGTGNKDWRNSSHNPRRRDHATGANDIKIQLNGRWDRDAPDTTAGGEDGEQRGKKRDRTGSVIASTNGQPEKNQSVQKKATHGKFGDEGRKATGAREFTQQRTGGNGGVMSEAPKSKKDVLLQEIIALGGNEEDLALVDGLDSGDEEEEVTVKETGKIKNTSRKDIEAFMKEIGLSANSVDVVDDEDEEADEEEVEDEDWTEEDDVEKGNLGSPKAHPQETYDQPFQSSLPTKGALTLEPRQDWFANTLPPLPLSSFTNSGTSIITSLQTRGKELLEAENSTYMSHNLSRDTNLQFLQQIMSTGTIEDKISALTIVCQASPLHTQKTLDSLLNLARKKSRNQTIAALGAIKDLFANGSVLPSNRKLNAFAKQDINGLLAYQTRHGEDQVFKAYLMLWTFEDWLKQYYFEVLKVLETVVTDMGVTWVRIKAVDMVFELLKEKPEGEANLLRLLVNKLGDSDRKVSSKTSHLLLQLQVTHPAMKSTLISAIEADALYKNLKNSHARYYSVITLNQTILTRADDAVANQLLSIYFSLFADILGKDKMPAKPTKSEDGKISKKAKKKLEDEKRAVELEEESNSKLISAVLSGVNRAFPFSSIDDEVFGKHVDTLFRITHGSNFNTSIQALTLIFQVSNSKQMVTDRFYRSLYESLYDSRLSNSSKQAMYLNMLFRALKSDHRLPRVQAFVKRIIQTASMHGPPFVCGVLYLLNELEGTFPSLRNMLESPIEDDSEEEDFRDVNDGEENGASADVSKKVEESAVKKDSKEYDGRKRDPLFSNADRSRLWEMILFLHHFHPTVALFANSLYTQSPIPSKPDLSLHSLTHFLDRFVYRNAKSNKQGALTKGGSIMQPLAGGDTRGMVLNTKTVGRNFIPVNSDAFARMKEENVKEDEIFFHRYFAMKQKGGKGKKEEKKKTEGEDEEGSELDDEDVWEAMVESRNDLRDGDVDMDDDEDDFDEDGKPNWGDEDEEMTDVEEGEGEVMEGMSLDELAEMDGVEAVGDSKETDDDDDEDDDLDLDDSDIDAGIASDDEIPSDLDEQIAGMSKKVKGKKSKDELQEITTLVKDGKREKRRKLKNLPTFASADDYAELLGRDDDEDV